jgi:ABC-type nitrate/sulfonate/bicarbonate transport system substrate-binding protein
MTAGAPHEAPPRPAIDEAKARTPRAAAARGPFLRRACRAALKIGYSDWPGWVAWQVAIEKDWFKEVGVDVTFEWFDYSASMQAFAASQVDAVTMTNGDALVTDAGGGKSVMVLLTDYSNGNDMLIGKPPIESIADLKGKKWRSSSASSSTCCC